MTKVATFWSINTKLSPISRYHLGQLSVAMYADSVVRAGGGHFAVICDNDALGIEEYSRISEISAAISSLCTEPLVIRTLTSFRIDMQPGDRAIASRIASEMRKIRIDVHANLAGPIGARARQWRIGEIADPDFVNWVFPNGKPSQLSRVRNDYLAGMLYLMLSSPVWFEDYWFPSMLFAVGRLTQLCGQPIELVEGHRNRYPWFAMLAALSAIEVPQEWMPFPLNVDLRPNVRSDGPFKSMSTAEPEAALKVHASRDKILTFCENSSSEVLNSISSLILGHGAEEVLDGRTVAIELASTLAELQRRWIFGPERQGPLRVVSVPASDHSRERHSVISVHGILTRGVWQKRMSPLFSGEGIPYYPEDLGLMLPTVVLSERVAVNKAGRLADRCKAAEIEYKVSPSIIAHSFGTLVVGKLLNNYHWVKLDKLILSGSILPRDFDWEQLLNNGRIQCVINLVAPNDHTVELAATMRRSLGPSGSKGFTQVNPLLFQPVSPDFGHSDWFAGEAFGRILVPLLQGDARTVRETLADWPSIQPAETDSTNVINQ